MKRCPSCNRTYADDSLSFCLDDGALLAAIYDEEETVLMSGSKTGDQTPSPTNSNYDPQIERTSSLSTYLLVGLVALLIGGGITAFLFYRPSVPSNSGVVDDSSNTIERLTPNQNKNAQVSPSVTPRFMLHDALRTYEYEQGWSGGRANTEYSPNISYYPVTEINVNGDDVVIRYAWKDGVIRGLISGNEIRGTWNQSNGRGPISFQFTDDFQSAKGTWSDSNTGESGTAIFRRRR